MERIDLLWKASGFRISDSNLSPIWAHHSDNRSLCVDYVADSLSLSLLSGRHIPRSPKAYFILVWAYSWLQLELSQMHFTSSLSLSHMLFFLCLPLPVLRFLYFLWHLPVFPFNLHLFVRIHATRTVKSLPSTPVLNRNNNLENYDALGAVIHRWSDVPWKNRT